MANGVKEIGDSEFEATIASGTVLVDFWAPWCGPCKMQAPVLEEVAAAVAGQDKVIAKINVDSNQQSAGKFGIQSIPTLLVFKDGKLAKTLVGLQQKDALLAALK